MHRHQLHRPVRARPAAARLHPVLGGVEVHRRRLGAALLTAEAIGQGEERNPPVGAEEHPQRRDRHPAAGGAMGLQEALRPVGGRIRGVKRGRVHRHIKM